jgi:hypothetical protein
VSSPVPPAVPPIQAPAGRAGCARVAFIGCGALALVLLAVVVGLFLYVRRNPTFLTDLMMNQIESHFASDVTEEDKRDLRAAYQEFRSAVGEKRVNQEAVRRVQVTFTSSRSSTVDREQVHTLTRAFREAAAPAAPRAATPGAPQAHPTP